MAPTLRKYYWWSRPADYAVLKRNAGIYHGVMAGAHMVAHGGREVESLLAGLGKPYFVDPWTYVLAQGREIEKKWVRSLVRHIDGSGGRDALATRLREGALRPRDFGVGSGAYRGADLTRLLVAGAFGVQEGGEPGRCGARGPAGCGRGWRNVACARACGCAVFLRAQYLIRVV